MRTTELRPTVIVLLVEAELLKLQKSGQFPDDPTKIKGAQIHSVGALTY